MTEAVTGGRLADALDALRAQVPLVHSLTNIVSANFLTNVVLAAGASNAHGVGGLPWRSGLAVDLLKHRPTAIRGNASEIIALAGFGGDTRGVDSSDDPATAVPAAVALLAHADAVSASGPVDHLVGRDVDGNVVGVRIGGGSDMLPRVTSTGCSLGGLVAAYLAVAPTSLIGLAAAHAHVAVASEIAQETSSGPGSFAVAYLDALYTVDAATLAGRARIETIDPTILAVEAGNR